VIRNQKDLYASLLSIYPDGLYIKNLTHSNFEKVQWDLLVAMKDPVLIRARKDQFGQMMESLIMNGLGPSESCAILNLEGTMKPIVSAAGNAAQRARNMPGEILHLLIAKDYSGLIYKSKSLAGKSILVTRAQKQARELTSLLQQRGANVVEVPAIEIVMVYEKKLELLQTLHVMFDYSWLILTSVNTVLILDQILKEAAMDWSIFKNLSIACIGRSTANAVRERGASVALVPPLYQAESLVEELLKQDIRDQRILLPRAQGSRRILPDTLELAGANVHEIQVYRAEVPETSRKELIRVLTHEKLNYITFTSSSTVNHFVEIAGELLSKLDFRKIRVACIGPVTAATLTEHGIPCAVQAKEFTIPGLVKALERDALLETES
jgi:uroporphyrinogen III methyltransferase / synthase